MNLVWGFFLYSIVGFVLLSIPLFHNQSVALIDSLFISVSAISTTGLVTVGVTESYNWFGQFIILCLFQIGGVGYMTLTTYYLLLTTQKITHWHGRILGAEFTVPDTIQIKDFLKSVVVFTLVMELAGAIAFYFVFAHAGMAFWESVWFSVFHSVSSFCTAGFGLLPDSFESYHSNLALNMVVSVLALSGSLGFIVVTDVWYKISGRSKALSFTTKIILVGILLFLFIGTCTVYFAEPLIYSQQQNTLLEAFFLTMSAMTTVGFNTIPTGELSLPILLLVVFLMYVGASPSGTAGGMKITTFTAMLAVLKSRLFGQERITFMHRIIPFDRLYVATSTFMLYTSLIFLFTFLLSFTGDFRFEDMLFEVASALGTVGLGTGITDQLSVFGKVLIIILMFIGRVGVLTFGFAMLHRKFKEQELLKKEDLAC